MRRRAWSWLDRLVHPVGQHDVAETYIRFLATGRVARTWRDTFGQLLAY